MVGDPLRLRQEHPLLLGQEQTLRLEQEHPLLLEQEAAPAGQENNQEG